MRKSITLLFIVIMPFAFVACPSSRPKPQRGPVPDVHRESAHSIVCSNSELEFTLHWLGGSLERTICWRWKDTGIGQTLRVPLIERSGPFENSNVGVDKIRYGPYQPAYSCMLDGRRYDVTMCHERADFPVADHVVKLLQWEAYSRAPYAFLSSSGVLVYAEVPREIGDRNNINITVNYITVSGVPVTPEIVRPFLKGNIVID